VCHHSLGYQKSLHNKERDRQMSWYDYTIELIVQKQKLLKRENKRESESKNEIRIKIRIEIRIRIIK
jgi:hypothetical protein